MGREIGLKNLGAFLIRKRNDIKAKQRQKRKI